MYPGVFTSMVLRTQKHTLGAHVINKLIRVIGRVKTFPVKVWEIFFHNLPINLIRCERSLNTKVVRFQRRAYFFFSSIANPAPPAHALHQNLLGANEQRGCRATIGVLRYLNLDRERFLFFVGGGHNIFTPK